MLERLGEIDPRDFAKSTAAPQLPMMASPKVGPVSRCRVDWRTIQACFVPTVPCANAIHAVLSSANIY
jgi:hypothetical protein